MSSYLFKEGLSFEEALVRFPNIRSPSSRRWLKKMIQIADKRRDKLCPIKRAGLSKELEHIQAPECLICKTADFLQSAKQQKEVVLSMVRPVKELKRHVPFSEWFKGLLRRVKICEDLMSFIYNRSSQTVRHVNNRYKDRIITLVGDKCVIGGLEVPRAEAVNVLVSKFGVSKSRTIIAKLANICNIKRNRVRYNVNNQAWCLSVGRCPAHVGYSSKLEGSRPRDSSRSTVWKLMHDTISMGLPYVMTFLRGQSTIKVELNNKTPGPRLSGPHKELVEQHLRGTYHPEYVRNLTDFLPRISWNAINVLASILVKFSRTEITSFFLVEDWKESDLELLALGSSFHFEQVEAKRWLFSARQAYSKILVEVCGVSYCFELSRQYDFC